jgi:hypothetical protein
MSLVITISLVIVIKTKMLLIAKISIKLIY